MRLREMKGGQLEKPAEMVLAVHVSTLASRNCSAVGMAVRPAQARSIIVAV